MNRRDFVKSSFGLAASLSVLGCGNEDAVFFPPNLQQQEQQQQQQLVRSLVLKRGDNATAVLALNPDSSLSLLTSTDNTFPVDLQEGLHPNGRFSYAARDNGQTVGVRGVRFSDTSGSVSSIPEAFVTLSLPSLVGPSIVIDPTGRFLLVFGLANDPSPGQMAYFAVFLINQTTGELTLGVGSPFTVTERIVIPDGAFDNRGHFYYGIAAGDGGQVVAGFSVGNDGTITTIPGSPFSLSQTDATPFAMTLNSLNSIASNGALTPIGNVVGPVTTALPVTFNVNGDGNALYVGVADAALNPLEDPAWDSYPDSQVLNINVTTDGRGLFGRLFTGTTVVNGTTFTLPNGFFGVGRVRLAPDGRFAALLSTTVNGTASAVQVFQTSNQGSIQALSSVQNLQDGPFADPVVIGDSLLVENSQGTLSFKIASGQLLSAPNSPLTTTGVSGQNVLFQVTSTPRRTNTGLSNMRFNTNSLGIGLP